MTDIAIPAGLRPADGRFGCGPSKIRPEQLTALAASSTQYLGTSHRQAPVRSLVQRARDGLAELFAVPDGYQVVLGNGGTTAFWEIAAFGLIQQKSQHLAFGEFSAKFSKVAQAAPWLDDPTVIASPPGSHPVPRGETGVASLMILALFDRFAMMQHWNDQGEFDLFSSSHGIELARRVHDCIGRALAKFIIGAAHIAPPQQN